MTLLATTIPGSSNNGYVAAAYIVFFAIVLIYVAIMAIRLSSVERVLRELNERTEASPHEGAPHEGARQEGAPQEGTHDSSAREREAV